MKRYFNITGMCNPKLHYMVDLSERLKLIKELVACGDYFAINRARQYGKTTTLKALKQYLSSEYYVISLDFQMLSSSDYENECSFVAAFAREIIVMNNNTIPEEIYKKLEVFQNSLNGNINIAKFFLCLSEWCKISVMPIVLMIDEIDSATNNQVFLDFLSQLRGYYIHRFDRPIFQSVILSSVYDVKNIKRKIRSEEEYRVNSPWNIAADFNISMSFAKDGIAGMLKDYEADYNTGMNIDEMASLIYDYTSGYPFLVSRICKLLDENIAGSEMFPDKIHAWTKGGFLEAIKILLSESNTLFESMRNKLLDYSDLKNLVYEMLFNGKEIPYNSLNEVIEIAAMFGFIKNKNSIAAISNRMFEMVLYNYFLSLEVVDSKVYTSALKDKNQFICNGHLNMKLVLERFVEVFDYLYGEQTETFIEDAGRRYFMLFLKPIINGKGNSYVEARTRNMKRTDIIVDYGGEQFIIELKIWNGAKYNAEGEEQLAQYLDLYHLNKGYMLTFNFNINKKIGVKEVKYGDKIIIEAVV